MEATDLHEPWLVAAWPGMGLVGLGAAGHLGKQLAAQSLGEVDTGDLLALEQLPVRRGLIQPSQRPRCLLFGWKAPPGGRDLVLLLGEAQPTAGQGWALARAVARKARELGATRVLSLAAMAAPIEPGETPAVHGAASDPALLEELRRAGVEPVEQGEISGLNGLLIGAAAELSIPSACLLGEFPFYAGALPNPRASAAVLSALSRLSGVKLDLTLLEEQAEGIEQQVRALRDQARESVERNHAGQEEEEEEKEDEEAARSREQIERLFRAASQDRSKALELKAELDRLGWFREYEDRFLDLFKQAG